MRLTTRASVAAEPGTRGVLRLVATDPRSLRRLRNGDVAVIDTPDLDGRAAEAMVSAGVVAVLNGRSMVDPRFCNRGPEVLLGAGLTLVDRLGDAGLGNLREGAAVRIHQGAVFDGEQRLTAGRALSGDQIRRELEESRSGFAAQLVAFAHHSAQLVQREEDALLHNAGVPRLDTAMAGRPVLVATAATTVAEIKGLRVFLAEQRPVVVAVGEAVRTVRACRVGADVVVVGPEPDRLPPTEALRAACDVVLAPGAAAPGPAETALEGRGVVPMRVCSALGPDEAALLLTKANHAALVVVAGAGIDLGSLLEQRRPEMAGTYLTWLSLGPRLIDAGAVHTLYAGRLAARHVLLCLVVCVLVVAAAIATTEAGQGWASDVTGWVGGLFGSGG
ncbi:MAG: putative cytokinetic ring protein SteA [Nocardioides sp.]|uniref:putative cytokinetic ring protein SteA n=1 Tax=Nocardioides sp. TaxID=35761 RepID=UPI0039E27888